MAVEEIRTDDPVTAADVEARTPGVQHDTELPRASDRMGPLGRAFFSAATIIPGLVMIFMYGGLLIGGGVADAADVSAGPSDDTTAALILKICSGFSWVAAGVLIWWGGIVRPAIAAGVAVLFAVLGFLVF